MAKRQDLAERMAQRTQAGFRGAPVELLGSADRPLAEAAGGTPSAAIPAARREPSPTARKQGLLALADGLSLLLAVTALAALTPVTGAQVGWVAALLPLCVVVAKLHGLYDRDHRMLRPLTADELPLIVMWATTSVALVAFALSFIPAGSVTGPQSAAMWALLVAITPALRALARRLWRGLTRPEPVVLVGSGELARAARRKLELFPDIHACVLAKVDDFELGLGRQESATAGGLATLAADLDELLEHLKPGRLILASRWSDEATIQTILGLCRRKRVRFTVVPPAPGALSSATRLSHVAELPLVEHDTRPVAPSTLVLKRGLDIIGAGLALLVVAPLLLLAALAVRLDSAGPVLFAQVRSGRNGRPFRIYKLRTMNADAEARLGEVGVRFEDLTQPVFKLRRDPRVTRVGRWLRRMSVDELPQLINVLAGDMSLVGPRPEQIEVVARYRPEHRFRMDVKPGLTGPMQVFGRGELSFDERLAVEREYVDHVSLGRDLRILLLTAAAVWHADGAY